MREATRFLSPVNEDAESSENDEINANTGGFEHAELMRAAYDDLLEVGLPLHVVRQGRDDDPDAITGPESAELRAAHNDSTLEPTKVASLVEQFRENNPLLDRLTDVGTVDIEAEHSTADTAPGATLEHIARSIENGRRCLLLARPDTAESIAEKLDDEPKCMRSYPSVDGASRCYNAKGYLHVGDDEKRVWRRRGGQNVWLQHADGSVELRTQDGEMVATFDDPADVFADPTAYPRTDDEIKSADGWSKIYRPVIPGRIDRDMVDVIAVTDDGLEVLEPMMTRRFSASALNLRI